MARRATWVIGLILVLATAGCGGSAIVERPGALDVQEQWKACPVPTVPSDGRPQFGTGFDGAQDALTLPRLDDSFHPVSAVICRSDIQQRRSGGSDMAAVEERATDLTALLAALALPDEPPTDGACTADLVIVPWMALLDAAGRWVRPGVPIDACRKPRIEFREALGKTAWTRVHTKVLSEITSDRAAASGCEQRWADMVWVTGQDGGKAAAPLPSLAPDDTQVRACVYEVPASERGGGKPAGDFVSGGVLPDGRWAAIKRELAGTTAPAPVCTTPATRFAVLHPEKAGEIYVEGDHCRRVLIDYGNGPATLRAGTPTLIKAVFG